MRRSALAATWARSPDGNDLALGSGDAARLTFVDVPAMRRLSTLDLGGEGY